MVEIDEGACTEHIRREIRESGKLMEGGKISIIISSKNRKISLESNKRIMKCYVRCLGVFHI